ncbi:TonB-dependent receptor plug domain-containing protein [Reichenbachiella sp. MALMAid0571]|uniref:TonB-dependent receptor plug domain-containing protein n=1 Tax=Reichenbachiella sp. MALMAid0571 TaxID=3143939 RepID=UPI0032DF4D09
MRFFFCIAVCLFMFSVYAQPNSSVSFAQAINHYQAEEGINFSFDSEIVGMITNDHTFGTSDLDGFIRKVEELLPIEIEAVDEKHYTIRIAESKYFITIRDSIDNQLIPPELGIFVLVNGQPIKTKQMGSGWSFLYKPISTDTLEVFNLGYKRKVIFFSELLNNKALSLILSPLVLQLSEVTVEEYLTKGINLNPANQSVDIAVRDLPLLPGETDGDIFAAITALPGVTTPDGRAGNLFIRGSETDQTLILFDNIPVYHRGHYYGTISPYNPKIVDNVQVYRSGFHPRLGDRVGGAIIINSDENPALKPVVGAAANTLYGSGYVKVPLVNSRVGLSIGVRRSYPRQFQSPKLNAISHSVFAATGVRDDQGNILTDIAALFEDYSGKLIFQANEKNRLSFSSIYTNTEVQYSPIPPVDLPAELHSNQFKNLGFNFDWRSVMQNNWASSFSATFSDYEFNYTTWRVAANFSNYHAINDLKDINLKQEFSKSSPDMFSYQFGIDYKWQKVLTDFFTSSAEGKNVFTFKGPASSHSVSPYANIEYQGSEKWYAQLGFRSTYYSKLNNFKIAPRLLVNYDANNWLTLKASTGMYNQYLSQARNLEYGAGGFDNELWLLADGKGGNIIEGTQSMAGYVINEDRWIMDVEAYYKTVNNITVFETRMLEQSRRTSTMDQKNYGIDIMLKRQMSDDASMWVGYSLSNSEIKLDTTDQVTYKSKYVQPQVWYIGGALKTGHFKFSAAWNYSSGLNAQSLDIIYAQIVANSNDTNPPPGSGPPGGGSGGMPPNGNPPSSDPFADLPERYPNVYLLNISASYKIPRSDRRKWEATFGFSLINAFDQKNLTDRVFRGQKGFRDRYALGFAPNLMVGVEF